MDKSSISRIFKQPASLLCVFAKEPVAGKVKTRLSPPLSADQACRLYKTSLEETIARFGALDLSVMICYAGRRGWFAESFPGVPLLPQTAGDLGARLQAATLELFAAGAGPVLFAGSDSPDLPPELVRRALEALREHSAVVIPCRDGGYTLIGQRRPLPGLFVDIPWSTPRVLSATRVQARELGLSLFETESWDDLDDIDALRRLVERSPDSRTARHALAELGGCL